MSTVFNELKKDILPELRRSQIVNSTDLQGLTDAEIMAAYRNGGDLTVEQYLYAAQELANGAEEQVAILTAASKKFNDARVWNNLGVAQTQAGDKAAALKSFEKAAKMGDMGQPDGWREMVCVESANALENLVTVVPGTSHTLVVEYRAESTN